MKKIIDILWKDVLQTLRSPMTPLFLIAMPLLFTAFFGWIFQGSSEENGTMIKPLVALVGDEEEKPILNELGSLLLDTGELNAEVFEAIDYPDPRLLFEEQKVVAVLSLPANFQFSLQQQPSAIVYVDKDSKEGQITLYTIQRIFIREQSIYSTALAVVQAVDERIPYGSPQEYTAALNQISEKAKQSWDEKAVTVSLEEAVLETADS